MTLPPRARLRDLPAPSALWADVRALIRTRGPHTLLFATIAVAIPLGLVLAFAHDTRPQPRPPEIIYIQNWSADRSDADIIAEQKQERADRLEAEKERRAAFGRLNKQLNGWL